MRPIDMMQTFRLWESHAERNTMHSQIVPKFTPQTEGFVMLLTVVLKTLFITSIILEVCVACKLLGLHLQDVAAEQGKVCALGFILAKVVPQPTLSI